MKPLLLSLALAALGSSAIAQDADDWDVQIDPAAKSTIAFVTLTSGLSIAVRCKDGSLDAVMAGLPEAPRGRTIRTLRIGFGDDEPTDSRWNVTTDRHVAVADYPSSFARSLREGGDLKVTIPGGAGEGRDLRHELKIPPSSAAIERVLTACGKPLEDPRDALLPEIGENGLPEGLTWARPPRPRFPSRSRYVAGYAVITCVAGPDGRLSQCQTEAQHPVDSDFAEAALRSTDDARLTNPNETPGQIIPRLVGFRASFYLDGYQPRRGAE